ncbi:cytochrome b [Kushneria sp. TE3]|uniref:cytochrome b n=1 Tax=Kushneria sp. TE3 TaxID=3449832 RepID=UPI003F68441C
MPSIAWRDTREYYGRISRLFHWLMAALLLWQFAGMIAANLVGRMPWVSFMVGSHKSIGFVLMLLVALRSTWGLYNLSNRPPHDRGAEMLVAFGQLLLYLLMIVVPLLGLTMNWASGKPLEVFGAQLMSGGREMSGLAELTARWHVWMAWTLGVLIAGHVLLAVVWHGLIRRDDTLGKMATRPDHASR